MAEMKDCLPNDVRKHFIQRRNVVLGSEKERYQSGLRALKVALARRGLMNSSGGYGLSAEMQPYRYAPVRNT
jgi:hypothetical protein